MEVPYVAYTDGLTSQNQELNIQLISGSYYWHAPQTIILIHDL
jgi:hypothetical protein